MLVFESLQTAWRNVVLDLRGGNVFLRFSRKPFSHTVSLAIVIRVRALSRHCTLNMMLVDPAGVATVTVRGPVTEPGAIVKFAITVPGPVAIAELTERPFPLMADTVVPGTKPAPLIMTGKVVPAAPVEGDMEDVDGSCAASGVSVRTVFSTSTAN